MQARAWSIRPAMEVLTRRAQHVSWLNTDAFRSYSRGWLSRHGVGRMTAAYPPDFPDALASQWDAPITIPSRSATAAIYSGAQVLADEAVPPVFETDLPTPSGLVFLPVTLCGRQDAGNVGTSVICWGPCVLQHGHPATFMTSWVHTGSGRDGEASAAVKRSVLMQGDREYVPRYLLRHAAVLRYGQGRDVGAALHIARHEGTRALRDVDPDGGSLPYRLIYAFWSMLAAGVLVRQGIELPPRTASRNPECLISGVTLASSAPSDEMVTVRATRVVDTQYDRERFAWDPHPALGGSVI